MSRRSIPVPRYSHHWTGQRLVRETGCLGFISGTSGTLEVSSWQRNQHEPMDRAETALDRVWESLFVTLKRPTGGPGRLKPAAFDFAHVSAAVWRTTRLLSGLEMVHGPKSPCSLYPGGGLGPPLSTEALPLVRAKGSESPPSNAATGPGCFSGACMPSRPSGRVGRWWPLHRCVRASSMPHRYSAHSGGLARRRVRDIGW